MKIGIVCYPTYGGSGVVATELGISLAEKGYEVHFITYSQPARIDLLSENIFYHEVNTKTYPLFQHPPYTLSLTSKLVDVVLHEKLDLLHVHYAIPHATAACMAQNILNSKGINIPIVTTLHGTDITLVGRDPSYSPVVEYSINASNVVTTVSESLKTDTYNHFSISKDIKVVPNFIDLEKFKKQPKDHFRLAICPNGEKLLIHVSNFRPVKRTDQVVQLFNEVRKKVPSKLLMVGDGPERQACEQMCRDFGACDDIRFLGKLSAVDEILSVSDAFLMPSESESFGLAALEAMACQVPVISSDAGGIPEVNIHEKTGYISKVGDVDDMIKNTIKLLTNGELSQFKKNALDRAKEFEMERIVPLYEKVYQEAMESIHSPSIE